MAPTFVSTLFSSRASAGSETPFPQTPASTLNSSNSSSSKNVNNPRNTLTSLRKFRTSFSSSSALSSSTSSTSTSTSTKSIDEEDDTPTRDITVNAQEGKNGGSLFASVPASYRYSLRPSTPLWSAMGAKLSKNTSRTPLVNPTAQSDTTITSDSSYSPAHSIKPVSAEEEDYHNTSPLGTVTRNTLKRTLSRLSLNAPTIINGRKERERNATSTSGSSFRSRSSPRLGAGSSSNSGSHNSRRESPRVTGGIAAQFRLPRLQGFSPNLRLGLDDDYERDNEESSKRKTLKTERESVAVEYGEVDSIRNGRASVSSSRASSKTPPSSSASPSITSSPVSRFTFSSSVSSSATASSSTSTSTTATDGTRYAELANLISIIEQSPISCRSPRFNNNNGSSYTAPNTPILGRKLSSFSLSKSLSRSKLKVVTTSPVILQPVPSNKKKERKDGVHVMQVASDIKTAIATTALGITNLNNNKEEEEKPTFLGLPPFPSKSLESRSYSFPYPSVRPIPTESELLRLKSSKSLDDIQGAAIRHSSLAGLSTVISKSHPGKRNEYYDMLVDYELTAHHHQALSRKLSSTSTSENKYFPYPALCTPPRTPQSRHASIEWYADIEEDTHHNENSEAVVACDESALMPAFLLRPRSGKYMDEDYEASTDDEGLHCRRSEAHDSLMDIIDSFPSPTTMTSPTFFASSAQSHSPSTPASKSSTVNSCSSSDESPGSPGSPNSDSIWSFRRQTIFGSGSNVNSGLYYSPSSSSCLATPASDITATPASSYFASRKGDDDKKEEEDDLENEGSAGEDDEYEGEDEDEKEKRVGTYVLASHRALTDILESSDLKVDN